MVYPREEVDVIGKNCYVVKMHFSFSKKNGHTPLHQPSQAKTFFSLVILASVCKKYIKHRTRNF